VPEDAVDTPAPEADLFTPPPQAAVQTPVPRVPIATATPLAPTVGPILLPSSPTQSPVGVPTLPPVGSNFDENAEITLLGLVNNERLHMGIAPLVSDTQLRDVARSHSLDMRLARYFGHDSPTGATFIDRLTAAGIKFGAAGENIAKATDVQTAFRTLSNDPSHLQIMKDGTYKRIGIGVAQGQPELFTLVFTD
jgi:uncharacterized protein YkwD